MTATSLVEYKWTFKFDINIYSLILTIKIRLSIYIKDLKLRPGTLEGSINTWFRFCASDHHVHQLLQCEPSNECDERVHSREAGRHPHRHRRRRMETVSR